MNVTITITVPIGAASPDVTTALLPSGSTPTDTRDEPPAIPVEAEPPAEVTLIDTSFVPPKAPTQTSPVETESEVSEPPSLDELGIAAEVVPEDVEPPSIQELAATAVAAAPAEGPPSLEALGVDPVEEAAPDVGLLELENELPEVSSAEELPQIEDLKPPARSTRKHS